MANLKTSYSKADLRDLVFYYADHSTQHYNYGGTPCSDHPLVRGIQGSKYNYSEWQGNGAARTVFGYTTTQKVLADNNVIPTIRTISPVDFGVSSGNPPAEWTGTSNVIPYVPSSGTQQQPKTLVSYDYNGGNNYRYRLEYAKPSNFTTVIKKIFTTQNTFSSPHDTALGNTIFNSSYATTLLNSIQKLVNGPDFVNYNLERLGAVNRSNGNWAEGYFSMMPAIDNIIENYANTNSITKEQVYFNLFKVVDISKINILVYFVTSENYYSNAGQYAYQSGWPDQHYGLYYITEIDRIPNALDNLDFYKTNRITLLKEQLRSEYSRINELFGEKLGIKIEHIYTKGASDYNAAKTAIAVTRQR